MRLILVHYKAFGADQVFVFDPGFGPHGPETPPETVLEWVFRQCNHVDGTEWIAGHKLRSMSVGDVVILVDGSNLTRWEVEGCGWKQIENRRYPANLV